MIKIRPSIINQRFPKLDTNKVTDVFLKCNLSNDRYLLSVGILSLMILGEQAWMHHLISVCAVML